jgi:hypothetical protein
MKAAFPPDPCAAPPDGESRSRATDVGLLDLAIYCQVLCWVPRVRVLGAK